MSNTMFTSEGHAKATRVYGLDVFRAIAILLVMLGHSFEHSTLPTGLSSFGSLGVMGVELFFVLSGFLIGSIIMRLIDSGRLHSIADIAQFWKRRWLRTLPMYFVALLAFIRFDYHGRHGLFDYSAYFVFLQNFATRIPEFFELSWSLAVEEHFYLWFPLVFLVWQKATRRALLALVLSAATFIVVGYAFRLSQPLFSDWEAYNRTIRLTVLSRLDAIMFGVLMAATKHYWETGFDVIRRATPISAALFVVLCAWWVVGAPDLMQSRALQINLFTLQAILCALLLPWFEGLRTTEAPTGFFAVTSRLSYSLYLVHILVIIAVNNSLRRFGLYDAIYGNPLLLYPIYFSLFYLASWVTYHQIEAPFLRLREVPITLASVARASWVTIFVCAALIVVF